MDVLVVESEPGAAHAAIEALEAADHNVLRCHDPGAAAFPCHGLAPGSCPLERGSVQVVLDVRGRTTPQPQPLEDGVTCALRRRLPVVVVGDPADHPFAGFPVVAADQQDAVAACERAADGPQVEHEAVADRALDATLRTRGCSGRGHSSVRRTADGLQVTLFVPAEVDGKAREMAAVRVAGAVRLFDAHAARIDVGVEDLG